MLRSNRESSRLAPLAGRGRRAERAAGEGDSPLAEFVESPPHPHRIFRCDATSPRKRGEVNGAAASELYRDTPRAVALMSTFLTLLWHCGDRQFSFRRSPRSVRWKPSVNGFGRRFRRSKGSGNADSQRSDGNRRGGGVGCPSRRDSGCVPAHPPSWAPSYLPLRADWARAPGHSGVARDQRPFSAQGKNSATPKKES